MDIAEYKGGLGQQLPAPGGGGAGITQADFAMHTDMGYNITDVDGIAAPVAFDSQVFLDGDSANWEQFTGPSVIAPGYPCTYLNMPNSGLYVFRFVAAFSGWQTPAQKGTIQMLITPINLGGLGTAYAGYEHDNYVDFNEQVDSNAVQLEIVTEPMWLVGEPFDTVGFTTGNVVVCSIQHHPDNDTDYLSVVAARLECTRLV